MSNLTLNQKRIFVVIILIVIGIIAYYVYGKNNNYDTFDDDEILIKNEVNETEDNNEESMIIVHITGAVKNQGIVELNENSRVADAVEKAGGLLETADMSKINLAYVLEDGMKIVIPSINDQNSEDEEEDYISTDGGEIVEENTTSSVRKWK